MGWLTDKGGVIQSNTPNKVITLTNQVLFVDDTLYLVPRNTETDNYTTPFGINKDKYDARGSHLHDIGCKYHKVIVIDLSFKELIDKYLYKTTKGKYRCRNIPTKYLKLVDVDFNTCNDLLYKGMRASDIPMHVCKLFRFAVNFNIHYLFTGKDKLYLSTIYNNIIYT